MFRECVEKIRNIVVRAIINRTFFTEEGEVVQSLILDNGKFYILYSNPTDGRIQPSMTDLAGRYLGHITDLGHTEQADMTIAANGTITGAGYGGCTVTGVAYARPKGNVYNLSLTYGKSPCGLPGQTAQGVIYRDGPANTLYIVVPNPDLTNVLLFTGKK